MRIAVLPGDGIGPEVIAEAVKVLQAADRRAGLRISTVDAPIGGAAIEAAGEPLPEPTLALCRESSAVLLGAVGGPRWDALPGPKRPEAGLLRLRRGLQVFANLRPVRCIPALAHRSPLHADAAARIDLLIVRELTGGLYFGTPRGRSDDGAVDTLRYHREEIARVVKVALQAARGRRRRLTSVDKANVLETSRLWREVVEDEARHVPEVSVEHMLVDTCAMQLVRAPQEFDVIVTENMFGDILSDEAGALTGSLGLIPSASVGEGPPYLYEPVHGSAPDIAGRGIANPTGAILSAAMLLRMSLGRPDVAEAVEHAVEHVIGSGCRTPDVGGTASTGEFGDRVVAALSHPEAAASGARAVEGGYR